MKVISTLIAALIATFAISASAEHHVKSEGMRAVVATIEAEITAIDLGTKEVTLLGPQGNYVTLVAQEKVVKLDDLSVGDRVAAEYLASLSGEVREPTEEEAANPWVVLTDQVVDENPDAPAVGAARQIRAVCTIEAADREAGFIMIKDSRGKLHTVGGISAEKFEGVSLGDTVVMVYTEALALGLNKINVVAE